MNQSLKILLVDDNAVNQKVASLILKRIGFSCETANNGEEAIAFIESNPVDVVLMDLSMPVMDGFEAAEIIRSRFASPPVLIALSAHSMKEEMDRCKDVGFSNYATKPIDADQLKILLDQIAQN